MNTCFIILSICRIFKYIFKFPSGILKYASLSLIPIGFKKDTVYVDMLEAYRKLHTVLVMSEFD
jgi:hypothetical protein